MGEAYLGAYWGDRPEGLASCAVRMHGFLGALGEIHPALGEWVSRRAAPVRQVSPSSTVAEVAALLNAGLYREKPGGGPLPELGFHAGLYDGDASLTVTCGLAAGNPRLSNAVALTIPEVLRREPGGEWVTPLVVAAVRCWEPDWAWIGSNHLRELQRGKVPLVGRVTFLRQGSFSLDERARAMRGVRVEEVPDGVLVRAEVDGDPMTAEQVRRAIRRP